MVAQLVISILLLGLICYLAAYLRQKAKYLAQKEDIKEITNEIEKVRLEFSEKLEMIQQQNRVFLEQYKSRHQLRIAAIDERLRIHQEAYTLWLELVSHIWSKDSGDVIKKCQEFWTNNCIYLEPEPREAFRGAYMAAHDHPEIVKAQKNTPWAKEILENWERITKAGESIIKAVELPTIKGLDNDIPMTLKKGD